MHGYSHKLLSDKLVPDKLGRHGHVTTGAGRDFPQFPTGYIHSTRTDRERQVNHNSHLNQSLYASCTREYATATGQRISSATIRVVTGVAERDQSRILASKQVRMTHNIPDSGPDPRGRKPAILRSDTAAITLYLSDDEVDINEKGKPWTDIAEDAGIELQET